MATKKVVYVHILPAKPVVHIEGNAGWQEQHGPHDLDHGCECWCEPMAALRIEHKTVTHVLVVHEHTAIKCVVVAPPKKPPADPFEPPQLGGPDWRA